MVDKELLKCLKEKLILGEFGAFTRPYVILDVDEYLAVIEHLQKQEKRRRVPSETVRA